MWKKVSLSQVCDLRNGRAYKKPELLAEGKYPVLRVGNFFTSDKWYFSDLELDETKYCDNGDLLYAWSASFGARMWEGEKVIYHYHIWRVDVDAQLIDKKFLYYWFEFDKEQIKKESGTGTTMIHVSKSSMEKRELWLPLLAEQQRIVAKLDAAFAEIDKTIYTSVKNKINITKIFDNAQIAYFSSPDTYKNCSLFDVCEATQGVQISKANQIDELRLGYRRYLYISDFQHSKNLKYVKDDFPQKIVTVDDIIVVNTGATAGKIFRGIDGILSNNLFKVSPDVSQIKPDFLFKFVNSPIFKNYQKEIMRGTANPHMGHQNFLSTPIKLPSLSIQAELLERLQTLEMQTENYLSALTSKIEQLEQLKSAILAQELQSEAA